MFIGIGNLSELVEAVYSLLVGGRPCEMSNFSKIVGNLWKGLASDECFRMICILSDFSEVRISLFCFHYDIIIHISRQRNSTKYDKIKEKKL